MSYQQLATTKKIAKQLLSFNLIFIENSALVWRGVFTFGNSLMDDTKTEIEEIKKFVFDEWCVTMDELSDDARISHDLGMDGDDAWEFMEVFAKHFQVDMSDFKFNLYFGDEGGGDPITWLFFLFFRSKAPKFIPITIKDLAVSAKQKKWVKPRAEAIS